MHTYYPSKKWNFTRETSEVAYRSNGIEQTVPKSSLLAIDQP